MSIPTRWNPFRQISGFDPLGNLDDLYRGLAGRLMTGEEERALDMRMNVQEEDKAYVVSIDLPGVSKKDIDISVDGRQVTVSAEISKRDEEKADQSKTLYSERFEGKAYRSFTLPGMVDAGKCQARYEDGVLKLTLPKKSANGSKRVAVH